MRHSSQWSGLSQKHPQPEHHTVPRVNPLCVVAFATTQKIEQEKTQ
jgi:hypothetical protein